MPSPDITIALALAAGVLSQVVARHARLPGIVVLLAAGVLLGPDVVGLIQPASVDHALHTLVGFAVAIILFEGGLNLDLARLRREATVIQRLVTIGALVTALGGTAIARWILEWPWQQSILFGTLVIVTGPTVITPLLRRIKVRSNLETILEAEGVFIDAVGAIIAVVALQVALQPSGTSFGLGLLGVVGRFALGAGLGAVAGGILVLLLRPRRLVPEGLENILVLSFVLLFFQISNRLLPESGIGTVTIAGVIVGNFHSRVSRDLAEFKEQLTMLFIGLLFVLLAADVRVAEVQALGTRGIFAVLALMFLVRPLNVLASTIGSGLKAKERMFLAWLAPRGIVAAAVASLFAQTLGDANVEGGSELRAMVFLVIASTVVIQGLTGGMVASFLGLRKPTGQGWVILGASDLGRALGRALSEKPREIAFIDSNADAAHAAEREGFKVVFGNGLEERTLARAQLDARIGCLAITANEEVNLLFARMAKHDFKSERIYVGLQRGHTSVTAGMVHEAGGRVLFRRDRDLELWDVRFRRGLITEETWEFEGTATSDPSNGSNSSGEAGDEAGSEAGTGSGDGTELLAAAEPTPEVAVIESSAKDPSSDGSLFPETFLPLAYLRGGKRRPVDDQYSIKVGDRVRAGIFEETREESMRWFQTHGWVQIQPDF